MCFILLHSLLLLSIRCWICLFWFLCSNLNKTTSTQRILWTSSSRPRSRFNRFGSRRAIERISCIWNRRTWSNCIWSWISRTGSDSTLCILMICSRVCRSIRKSIKPNKNKPSLISWEWEFHSMTLIWASTTKLSLKFTNFNSIQFSSIEIRPTTTDSNKSRIPKTKL